MPEVPQNQHPQAPEAKRSEGHTQPPPDHLPHEGQSARQNEPVRLAPGSSRTSTARFAPPAPVPPSTSSTTVPPTPTGPSTSATPSTSASRTSSSRPRPWPASTPPTSPAGTATACPSRSRSTSSSAAKSSKWPAVSRPPRLPRVRPEVRRPAALAVRAHRRLRPLAEPYLTMSFAYEAAILETFYGFFEQGFVYKGLKPVFWCIHDRTALAEAEVEYEQHTSPSIYVRYALTSDPTPPFRPASATALPRRTAYVPHHRRQHPPWTKSPRSATFSTPELEPPSTPSSGPPPRGPSPLRRPSPSIPA